MVKLWRNSVNNNSLSNITYYFRCTYFTMFLIQWKDSFIIKLIGQSI